MDNRLLYQCHNCDWKGRIGEMDKIDCIEERIDPGELMAAGECPECGSLVDVDDADVPDYVLNQVQVIMRQRGWTVVKPDTAAAPAAAQQQTKAGDVMAATRSFLGRR